jgi:hypothetical protein
MPSFPRIYQLQSLSRSPIWIADSGASHHFCNNRALFQDYHPDPLPINTANGCITSPGYGTVCLTLCLSSGEIKPLKLVNVRHTPSSFLNTISEDLLERNGVSWRSKLQCFVHLPTGTEFASVTKQHGLKLVDLADPNLSRPLIRFP